MPRLRLSALAVLLLSAAACGDATEPPVATQLSVVSGSGQEARVGLALPAPVVVQVSDQRGNPMSGATVTWAAGEGAGVVSATSTPTDRSGRAQVNWTLGTRSGEKQITAAVGSITPVPITARASAGAPSSLEAAAGNGQAGRVNEQLATPVTVLVKDTYGNGVPSVAVTFNAGTNNGTVSAATAQTNADGRAQTTWTLGSRAGAQALAASVAGVSAPLTISATAASGAASRLERISADTLQALVGQTVPLVARAVDEHGNPVAGATVNLVVVSGGGAIIPSMVQTGADGRAQATWTLGPAAGSQSAAAQLGSAAGGATHFTASAAVGALNVTFTGLPSTGQGNVTLTGPAGYTRSVTAAGTYFVPAAGVYTVNAATAINPPFIFNATPPTQTVNVPSGGTANAAVRYLRQVTDLQDGVPANGIASPQGLYRDYRIRVPSGSTTLTVTTSGGSGNVNLYVAKDTFPAGTVYDCYSVQAATSETCTIAAPKAGDWYILLLATTAYSDVTLTATSTAGGSMAFAVSGMPAAASPSMDISGPNGFSRNITSKEPLTGLVPGDYTVLANNVAHNGKVYAPSAASQRQTVTVTPGQTTNVALGYAETQGGFNLDIAGMYVTQATQTMSGAVPLIAGRDGLLRVFVRGSLANTSIPDVRVRIYRNGTLVTTQTITAPSSSAPVAVDEGSLLASWNYRIPGSLIQSGLAIVADVDVNNGVEESDEADNTYPRNGAPLEFQVRTASALRATLVPVLQPNGLLADVTEANKNSYVDFAHALYPLPSIDVTVRSTPYSFDSVLPSDYAAGGLWSRLLAEIRALRTTDGSSRYYYGVIKPSYSSGGTGLGYIGLPAAIGVDWGNWRAETVAHEWGHNFGRRHVGCGNPANPDEGYPYEGGRLGLHGWDMRTNIIRNISSHFDLMSYCTPYWSSDYTYNAVMAFRAAEGGMTASAPEPSLLVWGRTTPDGKLILEPAFEVMTTASLPALSGRYRLAATDATGATLFDMSFDGDEVDHLDGVRHFSYAVPLSRLRGRDIATLRVSGNGAEAVQRKGQASAMAGAGASDPVRVTRTGGNRVRLQWDVTQSPMVLVRDAQTGAVLSFARGGDQVVTAPGTELDLNLSDGVKSTNRRVKVQQ